MIELSFWQVIILAIGLVCFVEGILYAAFPKYMRQMLELLANEKEEVIQRSALICALIGLFIVWLVVS